MLINSSLFIKIHDNIFSKNHIFRKHLIVSIFLIQAAIFLDIQVFKKKRSFNFKKYLKIVILNITCRIVFYKKII